MGLVTAEVESRLGAVLPCEASGFPRKVGSEGAVDTQEGRTGHEQPRRAQRVKLRRLEHSVER